MKKIIAIAALLAAFTGSASELWWMIGDTDGTISAYSTPIEQDVDFKWDTIKLYWQQDSDSDADKLAELSLSEINNTWGEAITALENSQSSEGSFYVELSRSSDSKVAKSASRSITVLKNANAIYAGGLSSGASPYEFSGFTTDLVPEPTSGLLILLGMGALALRRRRA